MRPVDVNTENENLVFRSLYGKYIKKQPRALEYKVGEMVRISVQKLFQKKSATQTFTEEVFKIVKAVQSVPVNYFYLVDKNSEPIQGAYIYL